MNLDDFNGTGIIGADNRYNTTQTPSWLTQNYGTSMPAPVGGFGNSQLGGGNGTGWMGYTDPTQGYFNGIFTNGGLPNANPNSKMPTYDTNTQQGLQALNNTMTAGGSGYMRNGLESFMPKNWSTPTITGNGGDSDNMGINWGGYGSSQTAGGSIMDMLKLAGATGQLGSDVDISSADSMRSMLDPTRNQGGQNNLASLYQRMTDNMKDYTAIGGMSSGWDGNTKNDPRSASYNLYKNNGGVFSPVSNVNDSYSAPRNSNPFFPSEFLSAMSVALPMFGGLGNIGANLGGAVGVGSGGVGLGQTAGTLSTLGNMAGGRLLNAYQSGQSTGSQGSMQNMPAWAQQGKLPDYRQQTNQRLNDLLFGGR